MTTPYAEHLGHRRAVATTSGATLTGILTTGPEDLLGIDLGGGVTILYIRPEQVAKVFDPSRGRQRADGSHRLSVGLDVVNDEDWFRGKCLHEAAHAVTARVLGIKVTHVHVIDDRSAYEGGGVTTSLHGVNAQHIAVQLAAGPLAHARCLHQMGHDRVTEAAIEVLCGQGDHRRIWQMLSDGHVVWRRQAEVDAATLLDEPPVWQAIIDVADALAAAGPTGIGHAALERAIDTPAVLLSDHIVWTPVIASEQTGEGP